MSISFIDPSVASTKAVRLAQRPTSLAGKVIGLYDNTKEQADIVLDAVGDELVTKYGAKGVIMRKDIHYSKPAPLETLEEMARKCDVVICALGG